MSIEMIRTIFQGTIFTMGMWLICYVMYRLLKELD